MFYSLRKAENKDLSEIKRFVEQAGLSTNGFEEMMDQFVLLEDSNQKIVGCLGMEIIEQDGLLRSLVISNKMNQAHIVTLLQSVDFLKEQNNVHHIYLMAKNEASIHFLTILGFKQVSVQDTPDHVQNSHHVQQMLQNEKAILMVK